MEEADELVNLNNQLESMTILRDAAWEEITDLRAEIASLKSLVREGSELLRVGALSNSWAVRDYLGKVKEILEGK